MNSRTLYGILFLGVIGAFAFIVAAMMGVQKLAEKPLVRVAVEVAEKHRVKEVFLVIVPPTGSPRTLQFSYETTVRHSSQDAEKEEMETIAKFAVEKVRAVEWMEELDLKRQGKPRPDRGPINLVAIRRTWRSDRGCFKSKEEATHEWTPPPPPPGRDR